MQMGSDTASPGQQAWPTGQSPVLLQDLLVAQKQRRLPLPSTGPQPLQQFPEQSWQLKPVLIWKQPPLTHSCPPPQAVLQAPQLARSVRRSAHTLLQQVRPAEQVPQARVPPQPSLIVPHWPGLQLGCGVQQLPAVQTWPGAQVLSQMPQCSGSSRLEH
jgi:hypothetical protein